MNRTGSPFEKELYPAWCRTWLYLVKKHGRRLADWLGNQHHDTVSDSIRITWDEIAPTLRTVMEGRNSKVAEDLQLVRGYGCLLALESSHRTEPRRLFEAQPEVDIDGRRYVLVPPTRQTTRPQALEGGSFKLSHEIGNAGTLGLSYEWVPLQGDDILDWRHMAELDPVLSGSSLRLGLAPCASSANMAWKIDGRDYRSWDNRTPIQCRCAGDAGRLWAAIEAALEAAYREEVHVLLLPELVVDKEMLAHVRTWLEKTNLPAPRLRLVVAGSRHCAEGKGFANRCSVLDQGGNLLWEQDKRSHFVIDDPRVLEELNPGCGAEKAFEPTTLGRKLVIRESATGRLLSPICLDFIEDDLWSKLGADIYLVPAMTPRLDRFKNKARDLGTRHGAACFVANAQTDGGDRCLAYLPIKGRSEAKCSPENGLFTLDVKLNV